MKVLVACEESQAVCKAFREKGHEAYSCDLQECSGGHPEWHIKGDCLPLLDGNCNFITEGGQWVHIDGKWDLLIAHPPCTYLTCSGERWFDTSKYGKTAEKRWRDRMEGAVFFMRFVSADCDHIAIENPVGVMGTAYRKADQIVQPYEYGDAARKSTCLWLKGLPKLIPTKIVEPKLTQYKCKNGKTVTFSSDYGGSGGESSKRRSKTYPGIAEAMSSQWSEYIESQEEQERFKLMCPVCGTDKHMSWQSDFTFDDLGRDGKGTVHFYECLSCGTSIEISVPEDSEQ